MLAHRYAGTVFSCYSEYASGLDIITPAGIADRFDNGIVGCRMQNVIIAEIEGNVPDPFHPGFVVACRVRKEDQVASGYTVFRDMGTLRNLCARRHIEVDVRSVIKDLLHQRGTVVFRRVKIF